MDDAIKVLRAAFNRDDVFIIDSLGGKEYTYAYLEDLSQRLALILSENGVQKGDKVAILLPNCIEFVLLYFACMQRGAVAVPINIKLHTKEMLYILAHSEAKVLYADELLKELFKTVLPLSSTVNVVWVQPTTDKDHEDSQFLRALSPCERFQQQSFSLLKEEDTIVIIYTSGTTGLPKGVEFSYKNMVANALDFVAAGGLDQTYRFYGILPMAYMAGFYNLTLVPFLAGGSVVLEKTFDFSVTLSFWKKVRQYKINGFWLVPSIISSLLSFNPTPDDQEYCQRYVKVAFSGTAPLPQAMQEKFEQKFFISLFNTYGLSELLFVSANSPKLPSRKGVGKILPGNRIRIDDGSENELPPGVTGEIMIQSKQGMKGYYNFSEHATPSNGGFFATGDVGYVDKDAFLHITDRKKDLIIRGGINISPAEIEEIVRKYPFVNDVAVVGIPDDLQGEKIVVVMNAKPDFSEKELVEHCRQLLAAFKVPERFFYVDDFPRSVTGKIQKNKLKEMVMQAEEEKKKIGDGTKMDKI